VDISTDEWPNRRVTAVVHHWTPDVHVHVLFVQPKMAAASFAWRQVPARC
jgi:hypothetical protein